MIYLNIYGLIRKEYNLDFNNCNLKKEKNKQIICLKLKV
jgi:hypothetical protein